MTPTNDGFGAISYKTILVVFFEIKRAEATGDGKIIIREVDFFYVGTHI